jgi:dipeptidyl aminopeptidase/acylaminoacyl peptidase
VLQPQYRGSKKYGLEFYKSAFIDGSEAGRAMQDDKDDGALYLIEKGLADPERTAMFGWSYGGYAAFAASIRENGPFACAIAGAGVSDLDRIGAFSFNQGRYGRVFQGSTVSGVSPLQETDKLSMPLLIIHGDIDPTVPVDQSRLFAEKLESTGKKFKYVELAGLDHSPREYKHKAKIYSTLIDWLDNSCFTDTEIAKQ